MRNPLTVCGAVEEFSGGRQVGCVQAIDLPGKRQFCLKGTQRTGRRRHQDGAHRATQARRPAARSMSPGSVEDTRENHPQRRTCADSKAWRFGPPGRLGPPPLHRYMARGVSKNGLTDSRRKLQVFQYSMEMVELAEKACLLGRRAVGALLRPVGDFHTYPQPTSHRAKVVTARPVEGWACRRRQRNAESRRR
jgi:hypothetical protein